MKPYQPLFETSKLPNINPIKLEKVSKIFYHGWTAEKDMFSVPPVVVGLGSFTDARWFTDNEKVAASYGREKLARQSGHIPILYKVRLACKNTAHLTDEVMQYIFSKDYSENAPQHFIPKLKRMGFDSWATRGTKYKNYWDVAVFKNDCIDVLGVRAKVRGKWTPYMDESDLEEKMEGGWD